MSVESQWLTTSEIWQLLMVCYIVLLIRGKNVNKESTYQTLVTNKHRMSRDDQLFYKRGYRWSRKQVLNIDG